MHDTFSQVSRARIPVQALPLLAGLRCHGGLRVAVHGPDAWLRLPSDDERVVTQLLAIAGVRFYTERQGEWYAQGSRLPTYDLPAEEPSRPLDQVLLPPTEERQPLPAPRLGSLPIRLVSDDRPRRTRALLCTLPLLIQWADRAPAAQIERLEGARWESRVLLVGEDLPHLPESLRFWGERLLLPLGKSVEPAVGEDDLLEAWGAVAGDMVLFDGVHAEIVPTNALTQLSRASIRRAARGDR